MNPNPIRVYPESQRFQGPAARATAALALVLALSMGLAGCSGGQTRAAPVDPARAREALRTTLESWKKGEKLDALKSANPPIVAQDFDWMSGHQLIAYEVTGDGKDDDANLRIPVKLTLKTPQGKDLQKNVTYLVGTSPAVTVFRDFN